MSGRIPESVIAELRERSDIVEIISRHVELKRSGSNFVGLCPFHDEKTGSFNVNPGKQFFHCFGCRASGDVIGFLMRLEGRGFMEVVEDLAQRAGVDLPREQRTPRQIAEDDQRRSERQQAIELNARVAGLYRRYLQSDAGSEALAYLRQRGIGEEVEEAFQLGYAPPSGDVVARRLEESGIDLEFAARMGLVAARRQREGYHDRFWNRLIFPLQGAGGEVLGFGGRLLGDGDGPKYINTPETALYVKGQALFGLAPAAKAIRKAGEALLVEGNFDVLQLHQAGFTNTVAPMGTALTPQQVRLLRRFGERVVAIFDGDAAGRSAALRSVGVLVEAQLDARIATLPQGQDPDSLLLEAGPEALQRVIDQAVPAIDYVIAAERKVMEDSIPGRARLLERVAPLLRQLPSEVARQLYLDRLTMDLGIDRGTVRRALAGERSAPSRPTAAPRPDSSGASKEAAGPVPVDRADVDLLKILIAHPRLFAQAERTNLSRLLTSAALRATYATAAAMQAESGRVDISQLLSTADPSVRDAVAQAALAEDFAGGDPNRAIDDWLLTAVRKKLQRVKARIERRIKRAEHDENERRPLMQTLVELTTMTQRFDRARRDRQLDDVWALVPGLIQVEQDIHETQ